MTKETEITPKVYTLRDASLKPADYVRVTYSAIIAHGTPFEAILQPNYWTNVAAKLKQFDKIEVLAEDGSFYAEVIVTNAQRLSANIKVIHKVCLEDTNQPQHLDIRRKEFTAKWHGPQSKFVVIRNEDKKILQENMSTKEEAERWLSDYIKALAA